MKHTLGWCTARLKHIRCEGWGVRVDYNSTLPILTPRLSYSKNEPDMYFCFKKWTATNFLLCPFLPKSALTQWQSLFSPDPSYNYADLVLQYWNGTLHNQMTLTARWTRFLTILSKSFHLNESQQCFIEVKLLVYNKTWKIRRKVAFEAGCQNDELW